MRGIRKADRGLSGHQKSMTIVTFTNGSQARLWGFAHGRQVSTLQRERKAVVASVQHAIADMDGRGDIVRVDGTFILNGIELAGV